MEYNGYTIEEDNTGYAPKNLRFSFFTDDGERCIGSGETIEDCENQIDELNLEEIHKDANLLKISFENWIKEKGWWFIHPLKVYDHKNKEIYKTESELHELFLNRNRD